MPRGIYIRKKEDLERLKNLKYWKGRKFSDEHRKKLSLTRMGSKHSTEWSKNIGNGNRGKKQSEETKNKIRLTLKRKGICPPCARGIPLSEEARKKIKETRKNRQYTYKHTARRGSESHFWKGGITPENLKIRNSIEYKLWRRSCFERDNFICQKCKQNSRELVVHHINNFAEFKDLRLAIDNGITLCKSCHKLFHKKYWNRHNNINQLKEFLSY